MNYKIPLIQFPVNRFFIISQQKDRRLQNVYLQTSIKNIICFYAVITVPAFPCSASLTKSSEVIITFPSGTFSK